ncbi:DUF937 domain-containing protein [Phycicoccus duodecadis]|uniref:Uncharacterized protein DUF937 n=1 Tax=Phycicoccus duodecadis TaxID=173053 RepID=A0A2N3YGH3_9MICO|nr:DUF937 domain-containing protein [Phycicoccus duodecadis]PKW25952.1 uncharacterized protein DUF937 [Phycicoccus duodecadis]
MSAYDEILSALPVDDIAGRVGASPEQVRQAASAALPALLGGMSANAQEPSGASSLVDALGRHDPSLLDGGVSLDQVDEADGQRIAGHVFGAQQEAVAARLGESPLSGAGVGGQLVQRIIPILAPIVMSWLARQVLGGARGGAATGGGGGLQDVLGQVLGGATGRSGPAGSASPAPTSGGVDAGSIIGDVLGGLLGGGRR